MNEKLFIIYLEMRDNMRLEIFYELNILVEFYKKVQRSSLQCSWLEYYSHIFWFNYQNWLQLYYNANLKKAVRKNAVNKEGNPIFEELNYDEEFYFQWHITNECNLRCRHCYWKMSNQIHQILIIFYISRLWIANNLKFVLSQIYLFPQE